MLSTMIRIGIVMLVLLVLVVVLGVLPFHGCISLYSHLVSDTLCVVSGGHATEVSTVDGGAIDDG